MKAIDLTLPFLESVGDDLDRVLNGQLRGADRTTGFFLLVFPYRGSGGGHSVSNGARPEDISTLLRAAADRIDRAPELTDPSGYMDNAPEDTR